MEYVYIGNIVNTHGIKGELRILSDFNHKELVFVPNFKLYIGKKKEEVTILTYRKHKSYDMVTLDGVCDIESAIIYKGEDVYINRADLKVDSYINEDLIGFNVYSNNKNIGILKEVINNGAHEILVIDNGKNVSMVPFIDEFIKQLDVNERVIYINEIEGLINED